MRSEKGVSLITLIIYLITMTIVVAIIARASNYFYKNVMNKDNELMTNEEFIKFTSFFTKEINTKNNPIDFIGEEENGNGEKMKTITFEKTQNQYSFINNEIYLNQTKICSNIYDCTFEEDDGNLIVTLIMNDANKTVFNNKYKMLIN